MVDFALLRIVYVHFFGLVYFCHTLSYWAQLLGIQLWHSESQSQRHCALSEFHSEMLQRVERD